jgi:hypothetical protein
VTHRVSRRLRREHPLREDVVRWEYKPGSTLFVVWQQARENDAVPGGFRFGRDVTGIFGVPPKNVFLVKLAYWLNY